MTFAVESAHGGVRVATPTTAGHTSRRAKESMTSKWTNDEWLEALNADRESARAALRDKIVRGLLGYLRSSPPPGVEERALHGLVEDAAQETLITVRANLRTFRGESRLTTWVYRIAVNALLTELRRRRWERRSTTEL